MINVPGLNGTMMGNPLWFTWKVVGCGNSLGYLCFWEICLKFQEEGETRRDQSVANRCKEKLMRTVKAITSLGSCNEYGKVSEVEKR